MEIPIDNVNQINIIIIFMFMILIDIFNHCKNRNIVL